MKELLFLVRCLFLKSLKTVKSTQDHFQMKFHTVACSPGSELLFSVGSICTL